MFVLICVFGISAVNPAGKALTIPLNDRMLSRFDGIDPDDLDSAEARRARTALCREAFSASPDLSWIEAREGKAGVRS